jgi:PAS domain S-box-containing protein
LQLTLIKNFQEALAVLKQMPGNYLILKPDSPTFTIIEVSEQYSATTFTNRQDVIGKALFEVFPDNPNDPDANGVTNLSASLSKALQTKQAQHMPVQKYDLQQPGSTAFTVKYWLTVNKPVIIDDEVAYIIHSIEDITESRRLQMSESHFRALADETPFMVWKNINGCCKYVNKAWTDFTGLTYEESLEKGFYKAFYADDIAGHAQVFAQAAAARTSYEYKYRLIDKYGEPRWVMSKASPNPYNTKEQEYIGSLIDIHDLETASKTLKESEQQFSQMADSITQMIWITNAEGQHEYYNQRWYDFTGTTYEDTKNDGWNQMFHPDDRERAWNLWKHSLDTGAHYEIEYRLRKYTGEYVWVLGRAEPFYNEDGQIIKWFGTCTDIHGQKLLQQQKDDFISIASHELKTPITTLKASLQLLDRMKNNPLETMLPRLIEQSSKSMGKISSLVEGLLNVSRLNEGQLAINKTWFTVYTMLMGCCDHIRAAGKHELIFKGDDQLQVFADEHRIDQVITNLVNNAVKYAPDANEIYLIAEKVDNAVRIAVQDNGPGISPDKLPHLFNRYYRADYSGMQFSGLGLGLFISAEIVKRHGGQIGVDSELGKGSTFWFTLPLN